MSLNSSETGKHFIKPLHSNPCPFAPQALHYFIATMDMSDSLTGISDSLPFRLVDRYFLSEDFPGSPRFRRVPFDTRCSATVLDPRRAQHLLLKRNTTCCLPAIPHCRPLQRVNFGAYNIHLRCVSVSPSHRLHQFRHLH